MEEPLNPGKEVEEESQKSNEQRSEEKLEELPQNVQGVEKESEEKKNAIRHLFSAEINAQSISIASVREKIRSDPILCNEGAKKVYDQVRAQWRYQRKENNATMTVTLPLEKETVADRVSRMFNECSASRKLEDGDDSSDIISPTETTARSKPGVFSPTQVQCLLHLFKDMINGAPVSKPVIIQRLRNDSQAKEMQSDFTVEQVVNRLKYERKQKREKVRQKSH